MLVFMRTAYAVRAATPELRQSHSNNAHLCSQHKDRVRLLCPVFCADISQAQREAAAGLQQRTLRPLCCLADLTRPSPPLASACAVMCASCAERLCNKKGAPAKTAETGNSQGYIGIQRTARQGSMKPRQ